MRTQAQLQQALRKVANLSKFATDHKLPLRTLWRVKAGESVRKGTLLLISTALDKVKA